VNEETYIFLWRCFFYVMIFGPGFVLAWVLVLAQERGRKR
jgi:hypothetical protein